MSLAARSIREARSSAGLTQSELAERAGTSQPTIAAYEAGDKVPNVSTLERILAAAGVTLVARPSHAPRGASTLGALLQRNRDRIVEIASRHHAVNVRVFGSVARGEDRGGSDVDLLVDMDVGASLLDQVRMRRQFTELLGVRVDVVASGGLLERDGGTILAEAVPI